MPVSLTIDTDWAPAPVLEDTLALLDAHGQPATVFCTSLYESPRLQRHEAALHPNYFAAMGDEEQCLRRLLAWYPQAVGVRAHSLMLHGRLLTQTYPSLGLRYSSDYLMPYQEDIRPFRIFDLWQLPIYFSDITWLRLREGGRGEAPAPARCPTTGDGLRVFCFHPVHVYLNTPNVEYYERCKAHYQEPDRLLAMRNTARPGVRDALLELLGAWDASGVRAVSLRDIVARAEAGQAA